MSHSDYWLEAVESSFEEHGITATAEQIKGVAGDIEISVETRACCTRSRRTRYLGIWKGRSGSLLMSAEKSSATSVEAEAESSVKAPTTQRNRGV